MKILTSKQEKFCIEVLKQPSLSEAYRIAYDAENMSTESINVNASKLMSDTKIALRVSELREKLEKKELYNLEESIKSDLRLLNKYESALNVLENKDSKKDDVDLAIRTLKYIGITGYNSAQDRLSKQLGFFEKDNKQKATENKNIAPKEWVAFDKFRRENEKK